MVRHRRSAPGIRLGYAFDERGQQGDELSHPLFEQLAALREHGSILHAARSLDISYRNLWGAMKRWEEQLGQALVVWSQGQPARLTPFADRLLWAEGRVSFAEVADGAPPPAGAGARPDDPPASQVR